MRLTHHVAFSWNLRLSFTDIDPEDPSRIFSFVLIVNDEEKYAITNCNPKVDAIELVDVLDELNESGGEDISILARRMRKFCPNHQAVTVLPTPKILTNYCCFHVLTSCRPSIQGHVWSGCVNYMLLKTYGRQPKTMIPCYHIIKRE